MPDKTSRFTCKGKQLFHYMGCSTFSQYTGKPRSQCMEKISPANDVMVTEITFLQILQSLLMSLSSRSMMPLICKRSVCLVAVSLLVSEPPLALLRSLRAHRFVFILPSHSCCTKKVTNIWPFCSLAGCYLWFGLRWFECCSRCRL